MSDFKPAHRPENRQNRQKYNFSKSCSNPMRARRIFYAFVALCVIVFGVLAVYRAAFNSVERTDYTVYIAAGRALLDHQDIYLAQNARGWRYVYPPPFAILLVPLAQMPLAWGALLWYLLTVAAIGASVVMPAALLGTTPLKHKPHLVYGLPLLAVATLLASGILRSQASPFMYFFMIATFYFHLKNRPIAAGFSLACAVLLKVFPIVLIVYFIVRRQWRATLAMAVTLALLGIALPSLYWGWQFNLDQIARWIDVVGHPALMENTGRAQLSSLYGQLLNTTKPRNQSLESLFLSLGMPVGLTRYAVAASAAVMLAAMWAAARRIPLPKASRSAPPMAESLLCGAFLCWSLLISPIAETHYFGALLWPLVILVGYVEQNSSSPRRKVQILAIGTACLILAMILTAIGTTALWRPLCIATGVLWLLCLRLIGQGGGPLAPTAHRCTEVLPDKGGAENAPQRPPHMLAHQRVGMAGARGQRGAQGCAACVVGRQGGQRVAQCHRHVTQPARVADAADGAAFGAAQKLGFVPREQFN
jgi:hypothetical protein